MVVFLARLVTVARRVHVAVLAAAFVVLVVAGAGLFALTQHVSFPTGLYWAITTATTVGYGDVTPHNGLGRFIASALMLTTIPVLGSLFALAAGVSISTGLRRIMQHGADFPSGTFRLVVGNHPSALSIADSLACAGLPVVLVADLDAGSVPEALHVVRGDPTDPVVVARARPATAQHALVVAQEDGDVLVSAILLRKLAPDLPIAALSNSAAVREALTDLGVQQTISTDELLVRTLATMLETPHAGALIGEIVDPSEGQLVEIETTDADVGRPLSALRASGAGLLLALVHDDEVMMGVARDPVVQAGDRLLVAVADGSPHLAKRRLLPAAHRRG